jgi:hypothetical protein
MSKENDFGEYLYQIKVIDYLTLFQLVSLAALLGYT